LQVTSSKEVSLKISIQCLWTFRSYDIHKVHLGTATALDPILRSCAGLPDGIFSNPKSQFGSILEALGRCWYILWPFGLFYGHKVVIWYTYICYGYLEIFS
jgi:hypothetical protein